MKRACQLCEDGTPADVDAKTTAGPWAYMCFAHFEIDGSSMVPPTILANIKE